METKQNMNRSLERIFFFSNIDLLLYGAVFFSIKSSTFISVAATALDCDFKESVIMSTA